MIELLEKLRKEAATIRAAPSSFLFVCVILFSACFGGFQLYYGHRLDDAEKRASQWKNDVDYWKDQASHSKPQEYTQPKESIAPSPSARHKNSDISRDRGGLKMPAGTSVNATTNAPDSAAVGINTGTVTVNPPVNPNKEIVTYDFRGIRRSASPGVLTGDDSATTVFADFQKKEGEHDWRGLAALAEDQKKQRPQWLTPYFAAAEAYTNLCDKKKAIENTEYFVQKAEGSPGYASVFTNAKHNLEAFKRDQWPPQCVEADTK